MQPFGNNVLKVIDKLAYDMFIVQQDPNVGCACVDFSTKQAKADCPKCLGTGKKIKIKKIKAAKQNNKISLRGTGLGIGELASTSVFYMKADAEILVDNIIVDGDEVDVIQRVEAKRSDKHQPVYYRCEANPKKANIKLFLDLFNKIIGRA